MADRNAERNYRREIIAAVRAGDVEALGELAIELVAIAERDIGRRAKQAERKRTARQMSPDVQGRPETEVDKVGRPTTPPSPSPSSSFPTPHITPSSPPPPASLLRQENVEKSVENPKPPDNPRELHVAELLETDADRAALTRILGTAPNRDAWAAEIAVSLEGMHGPALSPRQLGEVLRDYVGNGDHNRPSFKHFRAYLRRPDQTAPTNSNGTSSSATATSSDVGEAAVIMGQIRGLIRTSRAAGQAEVRFILKASVDELGAEVVDAYIAIGGAQRVLETAGNHIGILNRDFADALRAVRRGRDSPLRGSPT